MTTYTQNDFACIMSELRRAIKEIPPLKTAKDIVLIQEEDGTTTGFVIQDGRRAGVYFIDQMDMDAFVRRMEQRNPHMKWPVLSGDLLNGHHLGGLRLSVADNITWMVVVSSCLAGFYELVDDWLRGKSWEELGVVWPGEAA